MDISSPRRSLARRSLSRSRRDSLDPSLRASLEESFGYTAGDPLLASVGAQPTPHESIRQRQRSLTANSSALLDVLAVEGSLEPEALNERAVRVIGSIQNKLSGREFGDELPVSQQVQRLIEAATSHQNLSSLFVGWCAFW